MSTRSPHCTWTWCTRLLLALLAVDRSLAHVHHDHHDISERDLSANPGRTCGTPEPTDEERINGKKVVQAWSKVNGIRKLEATGASDPILVVPVCFHVIRPIEDPATGDIFLDKASLQDQLDALNQAFSIESCCDVAEEWCTDECSTETGIRFAMLVVDDNRYFTGSTTSQVSDASACTTRSINEAWYTSIGGSEVDKSMKRALRRGDARVLNAYFTRLEDGLLGYAYGPAGYVTNRILDGVSVTDTAIVGGSDESFNEGDTLHHEVGHWMGLDHTFSGGCDVGDRISDTAPEASESYGCAVGRDTCLQDTLFDPIHNYMDYSDDNCMYEFSPGQAVAMKAQYELYRMGGLREREDLSVGDGIPTDPLSLFLGEVQIFIFAAAPGIRRRVTCSTAGDNGDADLYMRSSSPPDLTEQFYDCESFNDFSNEVCFIDNGKGSIYVAVYAYAGFDNVVLTCVSSQPTPQPMIPPPVTSILLKNGVASKPISVATGEEQSFTLDVTPGSWVTCETTGEPTGDADLYVRYNAAPVIADGIYDCTSYSSTDSNEACALIAPSDASVLWATIQGWSAAENVILTCTSVSPDQPGDGSGQGDPHFKTWRGQHYDFHGACDLIFLQSKEFESGLGLDVHIRTKIRRDMSYISSAVLRIGSDVLEVESQGIYYLNGVASAELPSEFSGFEFSHTQPTDKQHTFEVHLGGRERIKLKTYQDFVSVLIEQGLSKHFGHSVGLLGDFGEGRRFARDGKTILDDANVFGQEWQVLDTDPTLFQTVRFPQHPQKCTMPTPKTTDMLRRRLLETSSVDELAAEKACAHWGEQGKEDCVFDVLTTGDLEIAVVGAY